MFAKKCLTAAFLIFAFVLINPQKTYAADFNLTALFANYWQKIFRMVRISSAPTPSPLPQNTPTITPTVTDAPTSTPTPSPSPTPVDIPAYILSEINAYRKSHGLSQVVNDPHTCAFANLRAEEISKDFSHDGFNSRIDKEGAPYPTYSKMTENIAKGVNYKKIVDGWAASSGHAENMRADTPFVCVASYGNYYAYEGWRP